MLHDQLVCVTYHSESLMPLADGRDVVAVGEVGAKADWVGGFNGSEE